MKAKKLIINPVSIAILLVLVVTGFSIWKLNPYFESVLLVILVFIGLGLGWNIISGFIGYVNLGYVGFFGIGAYGFASLIKFGCPWLPSLFLCAAISSLIALLLGIPLLSLKGRYFSIATLAFWGLCRTFFGTNYADLFTDPGTGMYVMIGVSDHAILSIIAITVVVIILMSYLLAKSNLGKRMLAIKTGETAPEVVGINTVRIKRLAFAISSFIAGFLGGEMVIFLNMIDPHTVFSPAYQLFPMLCVILGGGGTVMGPIIGGVVFGLLKEIVWMKFGGFHLAIIGLVLVVVMMSIPEGIIPWLKRRGILPKTREW